MRKLILLSVLLVVGMIISAQNKFSLNEGESAFVYSLPKTVLCVSVVTEKVSQKPGMFYRYSERYLATNKVITEEKTTYRVKSVEVKSQAMPDPNRTFAVVPSNKTGFIHLSVDSQGLLCGVNVACNTKNMQTTGSGKASLENVQATTLLPLGEEYMMAGSEAKLAEGAAKQIYRIRESRLGLLTADVEKLPADGASLKSMLDGLTKMERDLTELFIGKTTTDLQTKTILFEPDTSVANRILFRLSAQRGIVDADDLSGVPYFISIQPALTGSVAPAPNQKKEDVGIYTILPASTTVSIGDGNSNFFDGLFYIPQFGKIVPISQSLIKPNVKIKIEQNTGRLISIE